jgi:hypothetical protein
MNKRLLIILILIWSASDFKAQENNDLKEDTTKLNSTNYDELKLGGHRFIYNSFIKSPLITTYIQQSIGLGKTGILETPPITIGNQEYVFKIGDMAYSYLYFEYQQAIKDWIAFSANVTVLGRLGVDTRSLLSQGVSLGVGFGFNWLIKLYKSENQMLSFTIDVSNDNFTFADLHRFTQGIIDSGKFTDNNKLVTSTPSTSTELGLSYAYAFNKMFGVTANANVGYGESPERYSDAEWFFIYGGLFDIDLSVKYPVPFSIAFSYFAIVRDENTSTLLGNPQNVLFQLNYIGQHDFDIGLVFEYQWYKNPSLIQTVTFTNLFMDLKYFFL